MYRVTGCGRGRDRWDQGFDVTAKFLDYCNSLRNGFVAELNKKMRSGYSNSYYDDLLIFWVKPLISYGVNT
ncbi:hypothetical protein Q3G72_028793 [Acer saccharum]|nr:hypothetical protein Q3G72_028793 [Acer saccharum]